MTFDCKDLPRALEVPELLPDAREHARVCDACRRELWLWGEMSAVAPGLREAWESPDLWPRIRESLAARRQAARRPGFNWRPLTAIAAILLVAAAAFLFSRSRPEAAAAGDSALLTGQALDEVERAEAAYRASIDKLARLAQPKLASADNPWTLADREKLLVLDAEIGEVRTTADHNRFNAELRTELAALYRQKQDTLKEILQSGQTN